MKQIIVPGYKGSPEGHWQYWLREVLENAESVVQESWDFPQMDQWVERLNDIIQEADEPIQLIGHSMGCITIAFWAFKYGSRNINSAVLVAPADSESDYLPDDIIGFSPIPALALPFKTTVVGSHNDPYMSFERALHFANRWGADFIDAGNAGHINIESGYGAWDEILPVLERAEADLNVKTFASKALYCKVQ